MSDAIVHADAVLEKVFRDTLDTIDQEETSIESWFHQVDSLVQLSGRLAQGFGLIQATILARIEDRWDELPFDLRKIHNFQFRLYALSHFDGGWTTLQNHMRAARTFMLSDRVMPIDPVKVPISKLVLARSVVETGKIDERPELWTMLANNDTTLADLRGELFAPQSIERGISPALTFEQQATMIIVHRNGEEAVMIDDDGIKWDVFEDRTAPHHALVRDGIQHMFTVLGIRMDTDIICAILARRGK